MRKYGASEEIGPLEPWPFDNPASGYVIRDGAPHASGRLNSGGLGQETRTGIWRCTRGTFECTEQGEELMTILSGRCRLTDLSTGDVAELGPGDSCVVQDGMRARWTVLEDITKVFFGRKPGGY